MIALTPEPIDPTRVLEAVQGPEEGGVVLFLGRVRRLSRGRTVVRLDYEAYAPMAETELKALADDAQSRKGASRVAIVHRTGELQIGEIAVAIAVAAPHRREAFEACSWLIDELKERAPIWKKEWYEDGSQWISEHP